MEEQVRGMWDATFSKCGMKGGIPPRNKDKECGPSIFETTARNVANKRIC